MRGMTKFTMLVLAGFTVAKIGTIAAEAAGDATPATEVAQAKAPVMDPSVAPEGDARPDADTAGPGILPELLVDLAAERKALSQRAAALDICEADLTLVEATLTRQHQELSGLRSELDRLLANLRTGHGDDVERLVRIYESMKPAEAGAIISDLDLEVATLVIASMKERNSGPILAKMDQGRARIISKIIYERAKMPGDQKPVVVPRDG